MKFALPKKEEKTTVQSKQEAEQESRMFSVKIATFNFFTIKGKKPAATAQDIEAFIEKMEAGAISKPAMAHALLRVLAHELSLGDSSKPGPITLEKASECIRKLEQTPLLLDFCLGTKRVFWEPDSEARESKALAIALNALAPDTASGKVSIGANEFWDMCAYCVSRGDAHGDMLKDGVKNLVRSPSISTLSSACGALLARSSSPAEAAGKLTSLLEPKEAACSVLLFTGPKRKELAKEVFSRIGKKELLDSYPFILSTISDRFAAYEPGSFENLALFIHGLILENPGKKEEVSSAFAIAMANLVRSHAAPGSKSGSIPLSPTLWPKIVSFDRKEADEAAAELALNAFEKGKTAPAFYVIDMLLASPSLKPLGKAALGSVCARTAATPLGNEDLSNVLLRLAELDNSYPGIVIWHDVWHPSWLPAVIDWLVGKNSKRAAVAQQLLPKFGPSALPYLVPHLGKNPHVPAIMIRIAKKCPASEAKRLAAQLAQISVLSTDQDAASDAHSILKTMGSHSIRALLSVYKKHPEKAGKVMDALKEIAKDQKIDTGVVAKSEKPADIAKILENYLLKEDTAA